MSLPEGWRETTLGELINIFNTRRIPLSKQERQKIKGIYPYYGASNIFDYINDYIFDGEYLLISEDGENLNTRNTPIAFMVNGKFWVNNHAHIVQGKNKHLTKYLALYFSQLDVSPYITGAVQPKLSKTNLLQIPIVLSENIEEQKAIANMLSSFDEKMELLKEQNETLEQMAQGVFREWFVDESWEVKTLGNIGKVITGKTPSTKKEEYWGNNLPFITPTDFKNYGKFTFSAIRFLSKDGKEKMKKSILPKDSILVTCIGSDMGKVVISTSECLTNQQINSLILDDNYMIEYTYQYLKSIYSYLRNIALGGSTMPIINKSSFEEIEITIPPKELLLKYNSIVNVLNEKLKNNISQIQTLQKTRDTLLPKLMSGEVRVGGDCYRTD